MTSRQAWYADKEQSLSSRKLTCKLLHNVPAHTECGFLGEAESLGRVRQVLLDRDGRAFSHRDGRFNRRRRGRWERRSMLSKLLARLGEPLAAIYEGLDNVLDRRSRYRCSLARPTEEEQEDEGVRLHLVLDGEKNSYVVQEKHKGPQKVQKSHTISMQTLRNSIATRERTLSEDSFEDLGAHALVEAGETLSSTIRAQKMSQRDKVFSGTSATQTRRTYLGSVDSAEDIDRTVGCWRCTRGPYLFACH